MTGMNLNDIEQNGKLARENGLGLMQNPYFLRENMPRSTGESFHEWQEKVHHWNVGWYSAGQTERKRA
jgi:hypothetical protein